MTDLLAIKEQLDRIDEKIDNKISDRWLTTREVCRYTGLSNQTVFHLISSSETRNDFHKVFYNRLSNNVWGDTH